MIYKIPDQVVDELHENVEKMEKHVFDLADEDRSYEDAVQREREMRLYDALNECVSKGVSKESLKVLAFETGGTTWALKESLKG